MSHRVLLLACHVFSLFQNGAIFLSSYYFYSGFFLRALVYVVLDFCVLVYTISSSSFISDQHGGKTDVLQVTGMDLAYAFFLRRKLRRRYGLNAEMWSDDGMITLPRSLHKSQEFDYFFNFIDSMVVVSKFR